MNALEKLKNQLAGETMMADFPYPHGILTNALIDEMPKSHVRLFVDAYMRAWKSRSYQGSELILSFNLFERGPLYKKHHYGSFLMKVFAKAHMLGLVTGLTPDSNNLKFINNYLFVEKKL